MTAPATIEPVIIIGAGPAGLATAACLRREGVPFTVLERGNTVGASWHRHYDRLHLHTVKRHSQLPFRDFPRHYPRYPSRQQFIDYLNEYAKAFDIRPRFGETVVRAECTDGQWSVTTERGSFRSQLLVVATGLSGTPVRPQFAGVESFAGEVLHSSEYRNGSRFAGKQVLVVGCGNSGAEIAIDLHEHGAQPWMSVRGPVWFTLRDSMGTPVQETTILLDRLPFGLGDILARGILRLTVGDLSRYGITRPATGPLRQITETGRIPVIDVGTIRLIKRGDVKVVQGVRSFTPAGAVFADGRDLPFDAVILATGYQPGYSSWLRQPEGAPEDHGLYFVGFKSPATGLLREISREARRAAAEITGGAYKLATSARA